MGISGTVILVTAESKTVSEVSSALGLNGRFSSEAVLRTLQEVEGRLDRASSATVLVDIDPQPARILAEMDSAARIFSEARFIVLSGILNSDLVLQSMNAGARHFVLKQSIASDLADVVRRFVPVESARPASRGAVISVFSASGGCGATTLAINLANELHLISSEPALLIDLDSHYGATASYLGLKGEYGIAEVLARKGQIDPQLIGSTALKYSDGLHVLISPASINHARPAVLETQRLREAFDACKQAYRFTVVDAPRMKADDVAELCQASLLNLIVLQLTVKDLAFARRISEELTGKGVPTKSILPVLNRYGSKHAMIALEDAEKSMGGMKFVLVANDFRGSVRGMNYGQPLMEAMPRSIARRDVREIAGKIVEMQARVPGITGAR